MIFYSEDVLDTTQIQGEEWVSSIKEVPFTFLSVDIPPCPLFRDSEGALIIPQIPLFEVFSHTSAIATN